jgi:hypothetical protein
MRLLAAMIFAMGLSTLGACATYPGEPAAAHDEERAFELGIDAGRIGVFNSRISEAGELVEAPATGGDELIGVSKRLRAATFEFLTIKERLCGDVKFVETSCAKLAPPSWLADDPTKPVTAAMLQDRIEQVQKIMGPLIEIACEAGKAKSGDAMFCSVE